MLYFMSIYIYLRFLVEDLSPLSSIDVYNANVKEDFAFTWMINCRPKTIKFQGNQSRGYASLSNNQKNCDSLDKFYLVFQEKLSGKQK